MMECDVLRESGQNVKCDVLTDIGQIVQCEVLTDSGQNVKCEVLTDSGQTVENGSGHSEAEPTDSAVCGIDRQWTDCRNFVTYAR